MYYALSCGVTFSEEQAKLLIKQTCLALEFLHEQDIVHRDIKSDNLLILTDYEDVAVKLTDFGLAVKLDPEVGGLHGFAGTPEYMAPEVVR